MGRTKLLLIATISIALGGASFFLTQQEGVDNRASTTVAAVVGESSKLQLEEARSLPFMDLKSDSHTLKGWEGKVLILNFWATWCPPCRREIPAFIELQDEFGDKGLQFVGVAVDNAKRVATYAVKNGINYPTLLGESNGLELSIMLGNSASVLPYTVIFDRNGTMISSHRGEVSRELMLEQVSPLL